MIAKITAENATYNYVLNPFDSDVLVYEKKYNNNVFRYYDKSVRETVRMILIEWKSLTVLKSFSIFYYTG